MSNTYRNMLLEARRGGYAIPAFNYTDSWEFLAIMEAAEELNAPVYAASARNTVDAMGLDICGGLGGIAYKRSLGNLLNHLDHCSDVSRCKAAVDAGYHSVMYDGSALPLDENIQYSRMVSSYAKEHGVWMEGEVGQILGRTEEGRYSGGAYIARMEDCVRMVEEGGVTSLAIGIGNRHGFHKTPPKLNIALLAQVSGILDVPLVLHGSSGLDAEVIRTCIENGISKVNVGTELHYTYKRKVREVIGKNPEDHAITSFALPAKEAMKDVARRWIKLCGADGKRR